MALHYIVIVMCKSTENKAIIIIIVIISYNNANITVTILRHMEISGIVRTVFQAFSSIFRDIQQYSTMFRLIEGYSGILRNYWSVWSYNQTYSELCVTLAYTTVPCLEPWLIRTWGTFKSLLNMEDDQAYSEHSQNSLFKHFQGYLSICRLIQPHSQACN